MTLDSENILVMETLQGGSLFGSMNVSFFAYPQLHNQTKSLTRIEKLYGAWAGALEQARALLDVIALISHVSGETLDVPMWATSLSDNIDVQALGSDFLSCELDTKAGANNFMK